MSQAATRLEVRMHSSEAIKREIDSLKAELLLQKKSGNRTVNLSGLTLFLIFFIYELVIFYNRQAF